MIKFLMTLPIFLFAVMIHEIAHGWVAHRLGDNTAKVQGRLSLNPIVHIDPTGTILLPLLLYIIGSPVIFGWAKPVPVNFLNIRRPKMGMVLVSLAGITANFLLAIFLSVLVRSGIFPENSQGHLFLNIGILINLILAVFNAVPIPPLDGFNMLVGLLPRKFGYPLSRLQPYGFVILFALMYIGLLGKLVWPIVILLYYALAGSA